MLLNQHDGHTKKVHRSLGTIRQSSKKDGLIEDGGRINLAQIPRKPLLRVLERLRDQLTFKAAGDRHSSW